MKKWFDWELEGKPWWKIVLRGAAIPGMLVFGFAIFGALGAIVKSEGIIEYVKVGIGFGLFFSLWGVGEVIGLILSETGFSKKSGLLICGYLFVWAASLFLIFGALE